MHRKKLCPKCETGKMTYKLDKHSPECPYLPLYDGKKCRMFVELKKPRKPGFLRKLFGRNT